MPTYEYECTSCGHVFERFQSMSDEPEKICPECGGPVRRRIGTGAGIIFKGRGFYTTDYRSKEYRDKAKAEPGGSSSSASPGKTTSSAKSDTESSSSSAPASPNPAGSSGSSGKSDA